MTQNEERMVIKQTLIGFNRLIYEALRKLESLGENDTTKILEWDSFENLKEKELEGLFPVPKVD